MTQKGKVKFFNAENGYGFIQPVDGSEDVFVHISDVQDAHYDYLEKNDVVEFAKKEGPNGKLKAVDIKVVN